MKPNDSLHVSQLRVVLHLCGFLVLLYSLSMLPPMVIALLNKERTYFAFLTTFLTFFYSRRANGGQHVTPAYSFAPATGL